MKPQYKRWYDHDPVLMEVIDLLKNYQEELKSQAEIFLKKIEEKVSKETIDKFYEMVSGNTKGSGCKFYKNTGRCRNIKKR